MSLSIKLLQTLFVGMAVVALAIFTTHRLAGPAGPSGGPATPHVQIKNHLALLRSPKGALQHVPELSLLLSDRPRRDGEAVTSTPSSQAAASLQLRGSSAAETDPLPLGGSLPIPI